MKIYMCDGEECGCSPCYLIDVEGGGEPEACPFDKHDPDWKEIDTTEVMEMIASDAGCGGEA